MNITWIDNNKIKSCSKCKTKFSIFIRRHHCRNCGFIFCYDCINTYKTCNRCSEFKLLKTPTLSDIVYILNLNIFDYIILSYINKKFYKIYSNYIKSLKKIYYSLPDNNHINKNIIIKNSRYLHNNPRWLNHIIAISDNINLDEYLLEIRYNKKYTIYNFNKQSLENVINYFYITKNKVIIEQCIQLLYTFNNEELFKYCFYFIYLLDKFQHYKSYILFFEHNINSLSGSDNNFNIYFWQLNYFSINNPTLYKKYILKLVGILDTDNYKKYIKTYDFCKNISILNIENDNYKRIIEHLELNNYFNTEFILPLYKICIVSYLNFTDITSLDSNSKPIKLSFLNDTKSFDILLKKGDLQKEFIMINLIKILSSALNKKDQSLKIITYDIVPLFNNSGIIEIIPDCENLYNIKEKFNMSIQNYIFDINPNIKIEDFKNNFINSCATTIVISYIFGIGDRHLENILINKNGMIFNIDFEYLLGDEPSYLFKTGNNIKITDDILDAIGGLKSKNFILFIDKCIKVFESLRENNILIYNTFLSIPGMEQQHILKYLNDKFFLNVNPNQALLNFKNLIINSCNNFTHIRDYIHKYSKQYN